MEESLRQILIGLERFGFHFTSVTVDTLDDCSV